MVVRKINRISLIRVVIYPSLWRCCKESWTYENHTKRNISLLLTKKARTLRMAYVSQPPMTKSWCHSDILNSVYRFLYNFISFLGTFTWTLYRKAAILGNNLAADAIRYNVNDVQSCINECEANPECGAVDYNTINRICYFNSVIGMKHSPKSTLWHMLKQQKYINYNCPCPVRFPSLHIFIISFLLVSTQRRLFYQWLRKLKMDASLCHN